MEEKFEGFQSIPCNLPSTRVRRRTRRDEGERSFVCGCGKDYLSYPALYTHIKQKHNGTIPTGTEAPSSICSRGRPRRLLNHHGREDHDELLKDEGLIGGPCDPITAYPGSEEEKEGDRLYTTLKVVTQDTENHSETLTCDQVFAFYLVEVAGKTREEGYAVVVRFVRHLRMCLNQKGWTLQGESKQAPEGVFCEVRPATNLPEISNIFITDYLEDLEDPTTAPNRDQAIHLMMHFNAFLFTRRLSNLKLSS